jgi:hypothetical protein
MSLPPFLRVTDIRLSFVLHGFAAIAVLAGCGDNDSLTSPRDSSVDGQRIDSGTRDGSPDGRPIDAPPDASPTGYPKSAADMHQLVGGTWSTGWLFDETSGTMHPVFGSMALVPVGSPGTDVPGPLGGSDKAIQILANTDYFEGDDQLFPGPPYHGNTDDVLVAWIARNDQGTTANVTQLGNWASNDQGWLVEDDGLSHLELVKSTTEYDTAALPPQGSWYVGMAVFDQTAHVMRIAMKTLDGTLASTSLGKTMTSFVGPFGGTKDFRVGKGLGTEIAKLQSVAAIYIGVGPAAGDGVAATLDTSVASLVARLAAAQ